MGRDDFKAALGWLKIARSMSEGNTATTLEVWRAEVFARAGRPDSALDLYEQLITPDSAGAARALDAAETMLDNGYVDQATVLFCTAGDLRAPSRPGLDRPPCATVARSNAVNEISEDADRSKAFDYAVAGLRAFSAHLLRRRKFSRIVDQVSTPCRQLLDRQRRTFKPSKTHARLSRQRWRDGTAGNRCREEAATAENEGEAAAARQQGPAVSRAPEFTAGRLGLSMPGTFARPIATFAKGTVPANPPSCGTMQDGSDKIRVLNSVRRGARWKFVILSGRDTQRWSAMELLLWSGCARTNSRTSSLPFSLPLLYLVSSLVLTKEEGAVRHELQYRVVGPDNDGFSSEEINIDAQDSAARPELYACEHNSGNFQYASSIRWLLSSTAFLRRRISERSPIPS